MNLVEEGFDIAVAIMDRGEDSGLVGHRLHHTELHCCASAQYVATHGLPKRLEEVVFHDCIVFGDSCQATWRFDHDGDMQLVPVRGRVSYNSLVMVYFCNEGWRGHCRVADVLVE